MIEVVRCGLTAVFLEGAGVSSSTSSPPKKMLDFPPGASRTRLVGLNPPADPDSSGAIIVEDISRVYTFVVKSKCIPALWAFELSPLADPSSPSSLQNVA